MDNTGLTFDLPSDIDRIDWQQQESTNRSISHPTPVTDICNVHATGKIAQSRRYAGRQAQLEADNDNLRRLVRQQASQLARVMGTLQEQRERYQVDVQKSQRLEASLLNDISELVHLNDEEIQRLRREIDRQALPPSYCNIKNQATSPEPQDAGPADIITTLLSARTAFRKIIAAAHHQAHPAPNTRLTHLARGLHGCIRTVAQGLSSGNWPSSSGAKVLHFTAEIVERTVLQDLSSVSAFASNVDSEQEVSHLAFSASDVNLETLDQIPTTPPSPYLPCTPTSQSTHQILRRAFIAADILATETLSFHFSSTHSDTSSPSPSAIHENFSELHYWHHRLNMVRKDILGVDEGLGIVVFRGALAWLEAGMLGAFVRGELGGP